MSDPTAGQNGGMSMGIIKKQLTMLDQFIDKMQTELSVMAQYSTEDVGPLRAFYAHLKELINDFLNTTDVDEFFKKLQGMNEAVAAFLIILVPDIAPDVQSNMKRAHKNHGNFDPSQFGDLVKGMGANMDFDTSGPGNPIDPSKMPPPVHNDVDEALQMTGLDEVVKKTAPKAPEIGKDADAKTKGTTPKEARGGDILSDLYPKYKS